MDGIINVYKPTGMTSFDVVRKIKYISKCKKVGHTGTLDPEASGVLPVCIGKGTKLVDYVMSYSKVYKAQLKLGTITDTYDREGKVIETKDVNVTEEQVKDAIQAFIGEIDQVPPMYSALKVNGKRLYELARQGIEIEREKRRITIFDINILNIDLPYVNFEVKCSKGTYIRSLCYDIGEALGCGGSMWQLERSATGSFEISNSIKLEDLTEENIEENLISIEDALSVYEKCYFDDNAEKLLVNGVCINNPRIIKDVKNSELCRVYLKNGKFIGLGSKTDDGFKIKKLLV